MRHDSEEELSGRILLSKSPHTQALDAVLNDPAHFYRIA